MRRSQVRLLFLAPVFTSRNKGLSAMLFQPFAVTGRQKTGGSKDGFSQDFPKQMSGMLPL